MSNKKKTGTHEIAKHRENNYSGCMYDCKYCWARRMINRTNSEKAKNWHVMDLKENKMNKGFRKRDGKIMYPNVYDIPYHPDILPNCINFMKKLLKPRRLVDDTNYETILLLPLKAIRNKIKIKNINLQKVGSFPSLY